MARSSFAQRLEAAWNTRGPLVWLLRPLSWVYALALASRRLVEALGLAPTVRLPVPVVVVGNLVAGGAGKTPTVLAVVDLLRRHGWTPGIVSRGHGREDARPCEVTRTTPARRCGDEPLLLHLRSGAPLQVDQDRPAAGRALLARHPQVDILVADDGLQHRRLARDAQLIVFDERGAGNGLLLPAGPLREPMTPSVPPRSVIVYNAAAASTAWPGATARRGLAGFTPLADWWRGEWSADAPDWSGRRLLAVAGIARPDRFFAMLRERGLHFDELRLPDHHAFETLPWPTDTDAVVLTEKDAVKLPPGTALGATQVWVATLDFRLDPATEQALCRLLPPRGGPAKD